MGIAIDIIIVLVLLFFIWSSARRGFVRTVIDIVGYILAMFVAFSISGTIADAAYDNFVKPSMSKAIEEKITQDPSQSAEELISDAFDNMPSVVTRAAENFGITKESTIEKYSGALQNNGASVAEAITDYVAGPVIMSIFTGVAMMIILITLMCIVHVISRAANSVISRIPIVGWLNKVLGAVTGVIKGGLIAILLCVVLTIVLNLVPSGADIISQSYILNFVNNMDISMI